MMGMVVMSEIEGNQITCIIFFTCMCKRKRKKDDNYPNPDDEVYSY